MDNSNTSNNRIFLLIIFASIATLASVFFYIRYSQPKIAFVRTTDLIFSYNGMRDAHNEYKLQSDAWQENIDTLKIKYQTTLTDYQNNYKSFSERERKEKEALIKKLENNLASYSNSIRQKAEEKEKSMTEGVLNQINSYVEEYSKKKGYDFVFGSSNSNIIYGGKAYDITDEVLEALNKEYRMVPHQNENAAKPESNNK